MPFTPIHLGPGLAFKAIGSHRFSFMVFGGSQVLMDIEPLIGILQNNPILHGPTHTLPGALLIGSVAALIGKPISSVVLKVLKIPNRTFTWFAVLSGAYVGTFSHVLLDAIMHSDMSPWWPLAPGNQLLHIISVDQLHAMCLLAGFVGLAAIAIKAMLKPRA